MFGILAKNTYLCIQKQTRDMKRFKLHGNSANWKNGLRMSAINLSTLAEVESSPIPNNTRMFVSVANNVFHVDDTRREIIKGEISDTDKKSILNTLKENTPDFLLTLENKVVGFAELRYCGNGNRVNTPTYDDDAEVELADLQAVYENSEITDEEYRARREEIVSDFIERVVKPTDGAILLIAEITPATPKHSFKKDGLTDEQKDAVYDEMRDILFKEIFPDWQEATEAANSMWDDVVEDIAETADWESYEKDEINEQDVRIALRRTMLARITHTD